MLKPFRFVQEKGHFRVVVLARSRRSAQTYVNNQAISSIAWRSLQFAGVGHPSDPANWLAAAVRADIDASEIRRWQEEAQEKTHEILGRDGE